MDLNLTKALPVRALSTVAEVSDGDQPWIVVETQSGTIIGAVERRYLKTRLSGDVRSDVVAGMPPVGIVAARMPVSVFLASEAFPLLSEDSVVVIVDESGIRGVWSDQVLREWLIFGPPRGVAEGTFPGPPRIPLVTRPCRFQEGSVACAGVVSFAEYPEDMSLLPICPNPHALSNHPFRW